MRLMTDDYIMCITSVSPEKPADIYCRCSGSLEVSFIVSHR